MRISYPKAFFLLALAGIETLMAATRPVDGVKLNFNLIGSPEIMAQVRGLTQKKPRIPGPGEPFPVWLELETEFDSAAEFPELTFKYLVLVKSGQTLKLLEGEVVHVDVAPGRERHSVMYVGPKSLNRLAENKQFSINSVVGFYVEVSFNGQLVAIGQKSQRLNYESFTKEREKLEKVSDILLNKGQTPFAPLFFDYYEAIKPLPR